MASVITIQSDAEFFTSPTLQSICMGFCCNHAKHLFLAPTKKIGSGSPDNVFKDDRIKLRKSVDLPSGIWEELLENFDRSSEDYLPLLSAVVKSRKNVGLMKINLSNSINLNDAELRLAMANSPKHLNIHNCPRLSKQAIEIINEFGEKLEYLCIGNSTHIIPSDIDTWISRKAENKPHRIRKFVASIPRFFKSKSTFKEDGNKTPGLLVTPKLKTLIIWGHHITQKQQLRISTSQTIAGDGDLRVTVDYWEYITRDFIHNLEYLDLSSCQEVVDLNFLLLARSNIKFLNLHDVLLDYNVQTWGILRNLEQLRFLDVSQYNELASVFANPDTVLDEMVSSLSHLTTLDISGTNLAGFEQDASCGIVGLKSRKQNPLHFIGLLATHYTAANRANIPAVQIAGGKDLAQLLIALKRNLYRPNIVKKVIRMLHEAVQQNNSAIFVPSHTFLALLIKVMKFHIQDKHTIIVSMAALYHILSRIYNSPCRIARKSQIDELVFRIMSATEIHERDLSLSRNAVLIFIVMEQHLRMGSYTEKLVPLLVAIAKTAVSSLELFLIRWSGYLLVQSVLRLEDEKLKEIFGHQGIIEKLCEILSVLVEKSLVDQLVVFWTALWHLIHDVEKNFSHFVQSKGIEMSFKCIKLFHGLHESQNRKKIALMEAQMPIFLILSNILNESTKYNNEIITDEHTHAVFTMLEQDFEENQKLFYIICGFLCSVATKSCSVSLTEPSREEILKAIFDIMKKMDHQSEFFISYRHFRPIYGFLDEKNPPEVHAWALWTLTNLTSSYPEKYVPWLTKDGVLDVRSIHEQFSVQDDDECNHVLMMLIKMLKDNVSSFTDTNNN